MPRTQADSARRPTYIIVPYNGKIADITHPDTLLHTLALDTALGESRKIISVQLGAVRMAGGGNFLFYPNEGVTALYIGNNTLNGKACIIADGTQRLQYSLDLANDDWDLYCLGYVVEI